jgi:hypothetical protein
MARKIAATAGTKRLPFAAEELEEDFDPDKWSA